MGNFCAQCVTTEERTLERGKKKKPSRSKTDDATTNKASGSKTETAVSIVDTKGTEIIERPKYPTRPIDYYYKMNHKNRGIALIFNHETFYSFNMPIRKGTSVDRERLKQTFAGLGFDVRVYDNRTEAEIRTILENVAAMDHSDSDCLVVIMLSHGELEPFMDYTTGEESNTLLSHDLMSYIHAKDRRYPLQMIWQYFTDENCPTLKNKPRVFIIQACQGDKTDEGFPMLARSRMRRTLETDGIPFEPIKLQPILPQNDFLIAYATLPGYFSFRNTEHGSWFVQSLCKEINERKSNYDLLKILTFATQAVAYDYESNSNAIELDQKKQVPCIVSMLTKLLLFPKKETIYYD